MKKSSNNNGRRFSFSLLSLSCPRRIHKMVAREKKEVLPEDETDEGRRIHKVLADILSKDELDFTPLSAFKIYGNPENVFKNLKGRFRCEEKIRITIGGKRLTVLPDLLVVRKGERDIIDHKTGFGQDVLSSYRQQLRLYSLPFLSRGLKVRVGVHFVRYGRLQWIDILSGLDDYTAISSQLMIQIRRIEKILEGKPVPQPSRFQCSYCPFIISCPSKAEYFITDEDAAKKLAGEYLKIRTKAKKMEALLKIWVSKVGSIHLSDCSVGFNPSATTTVDEEELLRFLEDNDIPVNQAFSASSAKVKKLAKQYEEISSFVGVEYKTRWSVTAHDADRTEELPPLAQEEKQKNIRKAAVEIESKLKV